MLNTLIRDTLIDLATKRYGRVTMVLSELAKPGVWKDKLMIASEKLYDDDYKYIYLKAVVEVLSELDEEWGRYAREVYLVEQRLQKVFSSCSKKYPSTSDAELMENLTVLANLSPVDYEGDDIVEACFRICKAVVHAYMLETNYSRRLDNIRVDLCQKSQYVINTDSSEDHLLGEINKLKFYAGENIFDDWKRYCKLAQAWYLYYDKYGKNKSGESMTKSVLLQAFTRQKADISYAQLWQRVDRKRPGVVSQRNYMLLPEHYDRLRHTFTQFKGIEQHHDFDSIISVVSYFMTKYMKGDVVIWDHNQLIWKSGE